MILSDSEIKKEMEAGNIVIEGFSDKQLNGASYNIRLDNTLLVYETDYIDPVAGYIRTAFGVLDMKKKNPTRKVEITEKGYVLYPGRIYLGATKERTFTGLNLVPIFDGRSSVGRLGLFVHVTAGYGDPGFDGRWTLEITPIQPIRIYPDVEIAQIYYQPLKGKCTKPYSGKYQRNKGAQESMLYKDFERPALPGQLPEIVLLEEEGENNDSWETKCDIAAGR